MNVQIEISTTKCWMLRPGYVRLFRHQYENGMIAFEEKDKVLCAKIMASTGEIIKAENGNADNNGKPVSEQRDKFVSLLYVDGPVTRNGGACSYGSRELRDLLMDNADDVDCLGHIFYINTPGGSAWAKNDFQQAIDYAHSKNQPVIAFVDGMCCSAGMYLAALCDERYYMNPKDEIGCIGVMAAFYTEKDGEKNEATGETYHELYDPASFDKNKEIRDIANDGNDEMMIEELRKLGVEFREDVLKACPNATDDHLHGKVFSAKDVEGILVDGQKSLTEVFSRIVELAKKNTAANQSASGGFPAGNDNNTLSTQTNNINMKEQFPAVFALLGVEEMQMQDGGTFMNEGLLATLNANIEAAQKEKADALALVETLTAEKNELTAKVEELTAQAETKESEHAKAIEDINTAHATAIEEKDNAIAALEQEKADLQNDVEGKASQIEQLQADVDGARSSLTTAEQTLAERDQQITDLNAQLAELQNTPGEQPAAGAAPANNGGGAEAPRIAVSTPVAQPGQDYNEMRETWGDTK